MTLPDRLMVGHMTLNHVILVRSQVRQHFDKLSTSVCKNSTNMVLFLI